MARLLILFKELMSNSRIDSPRIQPHQSCLLTTHHGLPMTIDFIQVKRRETANSLQIVNFTNPLFSDFGVTSTIASPKESI